MKQLCKYSTAYSCSFPEQASELNPVFKPRQKLGNKRPQHTNASQAELPQLAYTSSLSREAGQEHGDRSTEAQPQVAPGLAIPAPRNACGEAVGENGMPQYSPSEFHSDGFVFFFSIVGDFSFFFFFISLQVRITKFPCTPTASSGGTQTPARDD